MFVKFNFFWKSIASYIGVRCIIIIEHSLPRQNKKFKKRVVDSAFISSIASRNEKYLDFGIIAQNEVLSVLLIPGIEESDYQSKTSNALAKVLDLKGKVIIGDKALHFYHQNKETNKIDLAKEWKNKYNLPFVFAVLCFNKNKIALNKLTKNFNKKQIKIPQYILEQYSNRSGVSKKHILEYLQKIDYNLGIKEKRALKLFLKLTKEKGLRWQF